MASITIINGIISILIAAFVAYIAYHQYLLQKQILKIDIQKTNLELYEKRFKIFEFTKQTLFKIVQDNAIESIELRDFKFNTNERRFLFDNEIDEYILQIIKYGIELTYSTNDLKNLYKFSEDSLQKEKQSEINDKLRRWFSYEYENVEKRFLKYLDFRKL